MDQTLQKLAMKSYLEARQRADLRRDIAARRIPSEGPFQPGDRFYYILAIRQSKTKQGITSGRWYRPRILPQEGAICIIDTGVADLRVNQSKLRKHKGTGDVADISTSSQHNPVSGSLPRERPDVPDGTPLEHTAPEVYWIAPQRVTPDVFELSDGAGTFTAIWSQSGLRVGKCTALKGQYSRTSFYNDRWNSLVQSNPVLLFIEPPPIEEFTTAERRPVALFCLAAALHQLSRGRLSVLVHPVNSTLLAVP